MLRSLFGLSLLLVASSANAEEKTALPGKTVEVSVTAKGFEPKEIHAKQGEQLNLVITRKVEDTCATSVVIDEYNVTVTPRILGGTEAPTLVDGKGFTPDDVLNLKLKDSRVVGNEIFLVYEKTEKRGREFPK